MNVSAVLSENAQATLLLTSYFSKIGDKDVQPLSPREWGRFAAWLKENAITPADLLVSEPASLLSGWHDSHVTTDRIVQLLNRGNSFALAVEKWQRAGLWVLTRSDQEYPKRLKYHLKAASPPVLFGCGDKTLLNAGGLAVVGSRQANEADLAFTKQISAKAVVEGVTIVSGGARGIDEAAMLEAVNCGGAVIGVMADSLLRAATSAKWRNGLMNGHVVLVSPFYPEVSFNVGNAMARNKYIYCLADSALVIHAGKASGTYHGAKENLSKGWVPLWVKPTDDKDAANQELVADGARWCETDIQAQRVRNLLSVKHHVIYQENKPEQLGIFETAELPTKLAQVQPNKKMISFEQGAQWVRADFHLHTRADREFNFVGNVDFYNSNYVDALERAHIRLGVITNHNKFDFAEFKALRNTAYKKGIVLLPGVELSVNDGANGIHTLIVFSDDWLANGRDYINPFLNTAFEGKIPEQYEHENERCSLSLLETIKKLESYHRDFFLVFAHVEAPSGLWTELDGGRLSDLGQNKCFRTHTLGFQKVRTYSKPQERNKPCRSKVKQYLKDWYPAELEGSDPKCIDQIGQGKACYIKLGELSFTALKFALSDPVSRVTTEPLTHKASYIRSIHFDGGVLSGQTLYFSPGLNTLIGIRGSGKSSILEAVRYALDIPRGEKVQDVNYKDELIRHTLGSGGKVTLTACDVYGQEFTISRIFREAPNVYLSGKLQPGVSVRETILRRPIYFGQKDLSSTGEGFESDLVEKLVGEKLRGLRSEIETQRQRVRDAANRWLKFKDIAEQRRDYQQQLIDANFHLQKFNEYGIADKLQKRLGFQQDAAALVRLHTRINNFTVALGSLLAEHEDELRNAAHYVSRQNPQFFADYYTKFSQLIAEVEQLKQIEQTALTIAEELATQKSRFNDAYQSLQEEFAQVERQLVQELKQTGMTAIQPDDFLAQQQRKIKAEQMLEALAKQESQQLSIRDALFAELDKLNQLWLHEFNTIKAELDRVNASNTPLQIEAYFKGDKNAVIGFMQQLFKGSNIRETTLRTVMKDYVDFAGLLRAWPDALKMVSSPEAFEKTFMQSLAEFITWQVPNRFVIRYRGKELKHHSLGQRASALLLYVLSQRQNDVIIIDQPEDDLDNQTIYDDVIKLLREMKPYAQFIFATHNANFPVLGDAEQVHACQYQDEKVTTQSGSIDTRSVQEAIINIMEGGRDAFYRRKEVYNLWKPQS